MKFHELKILDIYYEEVANGTKPFELRKNDRDYQVGDLIHFTILNSGKIKDPLVPNEESMVNIWNNAHKNRVYQITYVLKDVPQYGLHKDYCIFGLKKLEAK